MENLEKAVFGNHFNVEAIPSYQNVQVSPDGMIIKSTTETVDGAQYLSRITLHPPEEIDITPRERYIIRSYISVLHIWGFHIDFHNPEEYDTNAPFRMESPISIRSKVYLRTAPQLFDITLSSKDLREFLSRLEGIDNIQDIVSSTTLLSSISNISSTGQDNFRSRGMHILRSQLYFKNIRPLAITRILNSKACRGAIMFGEELSHDQCVHLLQRLSYTKLPFQCAHGRPSMVPLVTLIDNTKTTMSNK